jgi:HSP20 family protein
MMNNKIITKLPGWAKALLAALVIVVCWQGWLLHQLSINTIDAEPPDAKTASSDAPIVQLPEVTLFNEPDWILPAPLDSVDWDPFADMQRMREKIDRLFGNALGRAQQSKRFGDLFGSEFLISPRTDVSESAKAYDVTVDLPGADNSQIEVTLKGQTLTVRATTESETENETIKNGSKTLRRERQVGRFERSITFENPLKPTGMTQTYENGVLHVRVLKK